MKFALLGKQLGHSWSKDYFSAFFKTEGLDHSYENLEIAEVEPSLRDTLMTYDGLNVTIPYKSDVIAVLDDISPVAEQIGAVNCIVRDGQKLIGHNTDVIGFRDTLRPTLKSWHRKALILGSGGASKAVRYVLDELGIEHLSISRTPTGIQRRYDDLNANAMQFFPLIINCTPLGMYPEVDCCPDLPYEHMNEQNFIVDLIYNPQETLLMKKAQARGAQVRNGEVMLRSQAEASWKLWTQESQR